jgi:hypothetical protein
MSFRAFPSLPVSLILPLFAVACMAVFYLTGHEVRAGLLNADALYLPTMFDDLLQRGGRLSDWYLTPAPYLFPDFPLYLLAWLLAPGAYLQIITFAALQSALLFCATYALGRSAGIRAALPCAAFSLVVLPGLALSNQEPFVLLLSNAFHFGTFVSGVLFVLAWLHYERSGARGSLWAACALAFATTLSDSLFLLQAALPLACTGAARAFLEPDYLAGRRRRRVLPWVLLGAAWLGHQGYKVLVMNRTRYSAHMDLQHVGANIGKLAGIAQQLWHALPLFALCWLAFLGLAMACAVRLALRRAPPFGLPRQLAWLMVFWLTSTAGSVAVSLLVFDPPVMARYFIAAACWPVLLAPLVAAQLLRGRAAAALLAAGAAGCALIGVATARQWQGHPLQIAYYPEHVACIDRALAAADLRHGIAQYWDAKTTQSFSRNGITLAHHDDQLAESRWVTSKRYFRPAYDFALVGPQAPAPYNIPPERLEALNGKPASTLRCGGYTLLLYGRDQLKVR